MSRKYPRFRSSFELSPEALPRRDGVAVSWDDVFCARRPLRVEVGVGNSPFLIQVAESSPEFNYLGFEYSRKRVLKFLKKVERARLTNIRILPVDASRFLEAAFEPECVDRFYIHHPDPWPKRRHAKKRFVNRQNAARLSRLLRRGGGLSLRTDVPAYAAQMLEVLDATEGLRNLAGKGAFSRAPRDPFATAYEGRFREQGRPIYYLEYNKEDG